MEHKVSNRKRVPLALRLGEFAHAWHSPLPTGRANALASNSDGACEHVRGKSHRPLLALRPKSVREGVGNGLKTAKMMES